MAFFMASRPHKNLIIVRRIADEHRQNDARIVPLDRGNFVDAAGVEEIQIARLKFNLTLLNTVFSRILVKSVLGNIWLDLLCPQTLVQNRLRTRIKFIRILQTQHTRKLVIKTVYSVISPCLSQPHAVNVWDGRVGCDNEYGKSQVHNGDHLVRMLSSPVCSVQDPTANYR